jgi:hypothetical protein
MSHILSPSAQSTPPSPFDYEFAPPSKGPPRRTPSLGTIPTVSSPLNPSQHLPPTSPIPSVSPFARGASGTVSSRPNSRGSLYLSRLASEDSHALTSALGGNRASMVLYRLATEDEGGPLLPPRSMPTTAGNRDSIISYSGDSFVSLSSDSKYPSGTNSSARGLVAYAYDPLLDSKEPPDDEDLLHDPSAKSDSNGRILSARAILNVGVLTILILGLLCLFIFYPVLSFLRNNPKNLRIDGNIRINATGQAPVLSVSLWMTFSFL